ncbi:MAG: diphthine--ammonia ligase [Candidatus Hydrothermarchaeales archaeon]
MKLAALTSGGKDSLFAAYIMHSQGFKIKYLLTVLPERSDSYMFHHPSVRLTSYQARAMGIPRLTKGTEGEKEKELEDLKALISSVKGEIEGVVSGALFSKYQKQRVDAICEALNLRSFAPLWHKDPEMLLREMLDAGFEIIITAVAAMGLDENWLGRRIDERCIEDLKDLHKKYKIHICGEGGEFESLVLDMPLFKQRLEIVKARKECGISGTYAIEQVKLVNK